MKTTVPNPLEGIQFTPPASITPNLQGVTEIGEKDVAKFLEEQRVYERQRQIAKLELEIEVLKARLDECRRTIAELIRTPKP